MKYVVYAAERVMRVCDVVVASIISGRFTEELRGLVLKKINIHHIIKKPKRKAITVRTSTRRGKIPGTSKLLE